MEQCNSHYHVADRCGCMASDDCPRTDMMIDESSLPDDQVVPCPQEHETNLAMEEQRIFENQIFIDIAPGSAEKARAYLSLALYAVLVCMTSEHKANRSDFLIHRQTDKQAQRQRQRQRQAEVETETETERQTDK